MRTYEQALQLAAEQPGTVLRGTADMYVGMSQIACERGDLHAAGRYLLRSQELGEHIGLLQNPYRWRVAMARIRESEGDLAGALTLLDEAQRVYMGDFSPNVRPVSALRARVLAARGDVGQALDWARERGPVRGRRPVVPAGIRAHHPGPSAAGSGSRPTVTRAPCTDVTVCWSACCRPPTPAAERAASSRSWWCRRSPATPAATPRARWRRWNGALTLAEPEGYVRVFAGAGTTDGVLADSGRQTADRVGLRSSTPGRLCR